MREFTHPKTKQPVFNKASYLVVPPALEGLANAFFMPSPNIVARAGTTDATTLMPGANTFAGMLKPVVSPYLSAAVGITGYSDTAYYVWGDPNLTPTAGVAYLNGQSVPEITESQPDPEFLGTTFMGKLDFGVFMINPRGAVKSAGA
jgi:hypothetical protein